MFPTKNFTCGEFLSLGCQKTLYRCSDMMNFVQGSYFEQKFVYTEHFCSVICLTLKIYENDFFCHTDIIYTKMLRDRPHSPVHVVAEQRHLSQSANEAMSKDGDRISAVHLRSPRQASAHLTVRFSYGCRDSSFGDRHQRELNGMRPMKPPRQEFCTPPSSIHPRAPQRAFSGVGEWRYQNELRFGYPNTEKSF